MWSNILLRVGIIGNGKHSKRIQKILINKKVSFFIYKPRNKLYFDKCNFEILKKNKIIFILSPNSTHFNYIKKLYKNRYIFCEKPPVSSKNQLSKLKRINNKNIYFNYNTRFSKISNLLNFRNRFKLGKLVYANLVLGHGLALKKEYKNNWRANKKRCPKGVFEVVSIHLIDLINFHFKIKKIENPTLMNFSKKGTSYDTSHTKIRLKGNQIVDIFSSYRTPLIKKNIFIFENGTIEQNEKLIEIRGPALNLDKNNFFIKPKLIQKFILNENKDYQLSLEKSVSFFLKTASEEKSFDKKILECSLSSNSLLF